MNLENLKDSDLININGGNVIDTWAILSYLVDGYNNITFGYGQAMSGGTSTEEECCD